MHMGFLLSAYADDIKQFLPIRSNLDAEALQCLLALLIR